MSKGLINTFLRLTPAEVSDGELAASSRALGDASDGEWAEAITTLRLHRIASLAWHGIHAHGLADAVPQEYKAGFQQEHRNTLLANGARFHALGEALDALGEAGIEPFLFKGVVLAGYFYPDIAMRSMGDADMMIEAGQVEATEAIFKSMGYEVVDRAADAVNYRNSSGLIFDVHHRVRLFEGYERTAITTTVRSPYVKDRPLKILAPEPLISHLAFHADGHRGSMGYVLRWIIDLHFVMNKLSDSISMDTLRKFIPSAKVQVLLLRSLGFLETQMGVVTPGPIQPYVSRVKPLSMEEVLRSRRLAAWGLPGPRGFARLASGRSRAASGELRAPLHPTDLLLWPWDGIRERLAVSGGKRVLAPE